MHVWRWIDGGFRDGATQIATDRAILQNASLVGLATMRVYGWYPHCISLGYNQSEESIDIERCREDGVDVVRRPTGGRAVLHSDEVTYSVVIPKENDFFSGNLGEIYKKISLGLCCGIQRLGVPAVLQKRRIDLAGHYKRLYSINCFSAAARNEIVVDGKKLVGSAQRQVENGILQHGSILTGRGHVNLPEYYSNITVDEKRRLIKEVEEKTISLGEYLLRRVDFSEVAQAIRLGMEEVLSIKFDDCELTDQERVLIDNFREEYSILQNSELTV